MTGRERNSRKQEQEVDGDEVSQEHVIGKFKPSATALSCIAKFLCFSQYFNDDENYKFYKYTFSNFFDKIYLKKKVGLVKPA